MEENVAEHASLLSVNQHVVLSLIRYLPPGSNEKPEYQAMHDKKGGTTTVGMKNAAPSILASSWTPNNPW